MKYTVVSYYVYCKSEFNADLRSLTKKLASGYWTQGLVRFLGVLWHTSGRADILCELWMGRDKRVETGKGNGTAP